MGSWRYMRHCSVCDEIKQHLAKSSKKCMDCVDISMNKRRENDKKYGRKLNFHVKRLEKLLKEKDEQ